jgi:hypothetical protein
MPLPYVTKAGVGTVTFSKAYVYPLRHTYKSNQRVGRSEARSIRTITIAAEDETLVIRFRLLPVADRDSFVAFIRHDGINYAENTFTFVDHEGTEYTVRYLDGLLDWPEIEPGYVDLEVVFAVEPVAEAA